MENKNSNWVNYLRFFGIIFVVLGHINSPLTKFIFSWHMPFFFIISGFFVKPCTNASQTIQKNFNKLMIPYFLFALLAIVIETVKRFFLNREPLNYFSQTKAILYTMTQSSLSDSYAFVLWFLPALFIAKTITEITLSKTSSKFLIVIVGILSFICGYKYEFPLGVSLGLMAYPFLVLGHYLYKYINSNIWLVSLPIFLIIYILNGLPNLDFANKTFTPVYFALLFSTTFACFLTILFYRISKHTHFFRTNFKYINQTLLIFALHPYTNNFGFVVSKDIWYISFLVSISILFIILTFRNKLPSKGILKYV